MTLDLLAKLEDNPPLSEPKAWALYKVAAISEAIGWTLLIGGIIIRHYGWPGSKIAVPIAGQIHGIVYLVYFAVAITTYTSLRWSRKKFLVAIIAGVPPYGSIIFEQWADRVRRKRNIHELYNILIFAELNRSILASS